ncbi:MAG TPA: substrate-binding domain-containing protein [Acidimicrobiales bacterium]|nr:substrate-binding domain-containing protein [Acidimicrobiales bacterium]
MEFIKKRRLAWLGIILAVSLVAAACGDDDDDSTGGDSGGDTTEAGADVSGSINISGSSTVEPITSLAAEAFTGENSGVDIAVDGPGTGDGFELFCNGETDISDASRTIDEEEAAACQTNGIEYTELQVGYDGMSVLTNANNADAPECLSFADLYALIGPESEGFDNWSDAQAIATELGSTTQFPDAPLELTGPGPESGTYDSFIEIALSGIAEERGVPEDQIETTRPDYASSADDNVIIQNIEASDTSLGWVGFAFAEEAGDQITEIPVSAEPGDAANCVEPTAETIADTSDAGYPLSRPLFIYVSTAAAEENPAVVPFVDFYLDGLNQFVEEGGYVTMPDDQVQLTVTDWEGR